MVKALLALVVVVLLVVLAVVVLVIAESRSRPPDRLQSSLVLAR